MPRVGRRRKKTRTEKKEDVAEDEFQKVPKCFVLRRGDVPNAVKELIKDFRQVMQPNCAGKLRESKSNRVEDFVAVSGQLGVSHIVLFTATKTNTYMKVAKLPQGPTLTYKLEHYSLSRDVRSSQKKPRSGTRDYTTAPLQVLNGFSVGGASEQQLSAEMLRGLFPSIDVRKFNSQDCRRVALFHKDSGEADSIHFRHYTVSKKTMGLQRGISRFLKNTKPPKLGHRDDIADYVTGGGGATESEAEDAEEVPVVGGGKVGVRLTELGPRLELQLIKAEAELLTGQVLYHRYTTKTPTQQDILDEKARLRKKLKARNDRVSDRLQKTKAERKKRDSRKRERDKEAADNAEFVAEGGEHEEIKEGDDAKGAERKRKFHPLYGKKRKGSGDGTVEIDSAPSKKNRRGGQRQGQGDDRRESAKGGGKGGKKGGASRVLDRFRSSAKKQRT